VTRAKQFTQRGRATNAKVSRHGLTFGSTTEADFYSALLKVGVSFEWQVGFVLWPTIPKKKNSELLRFSGVRVRKMFVDFKLVLDGIEYYIDTKGNRDYTTDMSLFKYNWLKAQLVLEGKENAAAIVHIQYDEVQVLLKLAMLPDKAPFWEKFHSIKRF
jgi:hypothetical protein